MSKLKGYPPFGKLLKSHSITFDEQLYIVRMVEHVDVDDWIISRVCGLQGDGAKTFRSGQERQECKTGISSQVSVYILIDLFLSVMSR